MTAVRTLLLILLGMGIYPPSGIAQLKAAPELPCKSISDCHTQGARSLEKGDTSAAIKFFRAEVGLSEDARDKADSVISYNDLALAYLHEHDYFRALSWTRLALRIDPENEVAKFNFQKIENNISKYKWPTHIGGLYVRYSGRAYWDSLRVSTPKDSNLTFHLLAYRIGLAWRRYGPGSYGEVAGTAALGEKHQAVYSKDPGFPTCRITMHFKMDSVVVGQGGDCGFGYGVQASGEYERICSVGNQPCKEQRLP